MFSSISSIFQTMPNVPFPLSIEAKYTKVAQKLGVFFGGVGAHSLQTLTRIELGGIASHKKGKSGASLVAQWLRICLPMQGTRVRALVWEDPTYRGATGPVSHNY